MNLLKTLRSMALLKYLLWVVVISFIMAIFFVWGGGGTVTSSGSAILGADYAVSVAGRTTSPNVLRWRYRMQAKQYRDMLGSSFKEDFLKGTAKRLADQMAEELILVEMAESYGLRAGDDEVARKIQEIYDFKEPKEDYNELLQRLGLRPAEYEQMIRNSLLLQKLNSLLEDATILGDEEVLRLYSEQNERFKAAIAVVKTAEFRPKAAQPSDADIQARYEREKASLNLPEKRSFKYLFFTEDQIRRKVQVEETQLRAFYEAHVSDFSTPATQRRASHILIKTAASAKPEEAEAARKQIQEILGRVNKGEDFAALANQFSQDSSASKGGDLGWFDRQSMVKPFADAVFDQCQRAGDVVGPVQSQFGFHIVKLTGLGGQIKPFDEVKEQVKQEMLFVDPSIQASLKDTYEKAKTEIGKAKNDGEIVAAAAKWDLKVVPVTTPFSADQPVPGLGVDKELQAALFAAPKDAWSAPMDFRQGVLRYQVNSIVPAHPATFEEAKADLAKKILDERAGALAEEKARSLASAKNAEELKARAKAAGFNTDETGSLNATDSIPQVGKESAVSKALLAASAGQVVGPLQFKGGWLVAAVTERTPVDPVKFAQEKEKFSREQRGQEAKLLMDGYVARRRTELETKKAIKVNEAVIQELEPATPGRG